MFYLNYLLVLFEPVLYGTWLLLVLDVYSFFPRFLNDFTSLFFLIFSSLNNLLTLILGYILSTTRILAHALRLFILTSLLEATTGFLVNCLKTATWLQQQIGNPGGQIH